MYGLEGILAMNKRAATIASERAKAERIEREAAEQVCAEYAKHVQFRADDFKAACLEFINFKPMDSLWSAFNWPKSPQGFQFWYDLTRGKCKHDSKYIAKQLLDVAERCGL